MTRRDWFSFADPVQVAEVYRAGPQDYDELQPGVWGERGVNVLCLGTVADMRRVSRKAFMDKFHAGPCRWGYWGDEHGGPPLPPVYDRLKLALPDADLPDWRDADDKPSARDKGVPG
jgi:hypothetical protein